MVNPMYSDGFSHMHKCNKDRLSILYLMGSEFSIPNYYVFIPVKVVLASAKSVDPDEMLHHAVFHLGLHSFQMKPFKG